MTRDQAYQQIRILKWRAIWNLLCLIAMVPVTLILFPALMIVPGLALHIRYRVIARVELQTNLVLQGRRIIAAMEPEDDDIAPRRG